MSDCNKCPDLTDVGPEPCDPCDGVPRVCPPQEWTCGGWRYTEVDGCLSRTRLVGVMTDGVYQNATITVTNGCISAVSSGTNVVQQRPLPCLVSGGTTPTPSTPVTINPDSCNLAGNTSQGILTRGYFDVLGSNVLVTGCGTSASPWRLTADYPDVGDTFVPVWRNGVSVQTPIVNPVVGVTSNTLSVSINTNGVLSVESVGVTSTDCLATIENGIVKAWNGGVIRNIIMPSGWSVSYDSSTCTATLTNNSPNAVAMLFVSTTGSSPVFWGEPSTSYDLVSTTTFSVTTVTTGIIGSYSASPGFISSGVYAVRRNGVVMGYIEV